MPRINSYTDNTTIEDDDKLLTYDTQGAATKLTAFSTVWNWIVSKLHALTSSGAALTPSTDRVLMDKNGTMTRVEPAAVAKYGIETYNGSTIAGSAQTVKSALDALNSNLLSKTGAASYLQSGTLAENIKTTYPTKCDVTLQCNSVWGQTDLPSNNLTFVRVTRSTGSSSYHLEAYDVTGDVYHSRISYNELTVNPIVWTKSPTRAEVDAINSNSDAEVTLSDAISSHNQNRVYKFGNVCSVLFDFTVGDSDITPWVIIASLPSGYRPHRSIAYVPAIVDVTDGNKTNISTYFNVPTNGQINTGVTFTANHRYIFSLIYLM